MNAGKPVAALCALALCACAAKPEIREARRMATISIASIPPGMVVELNDRCVGMTPMKLTVPATRWGSWDDGAPTHVLRCSTLADDEQDVKVFGYNEQVPDHVLFRLPNAINAERWRQALLKR